MKTFWEIKNTLSGRQRKSSPSRFASSKINLYIFPPPNNRQLAAKNPHIFLQLFVFVFVPVASFIIRCYYYGMFKSRYKVGLKFGSNSGQAMLEYILVFIVLLGLVAITAMCLYAVRQQSNRSLDLVASEYP